MTEFFNLLRRVAVARGTPTVTLHTEAGDIPCTLENVQQIAAVWQAFQIYNSDARDEEVLANVVG